MPLIIIDFPFINILSGLIFILQNQVSVIFSSIIPMGEYISVFIKYNSGESGDQMDGFFIVKSLVIFCV